jgi:hypothetical protein
MSHIKIYNPTNSYTYKNRRYNIFFDEFTRFLTTKFHVEECREFEHAHSKPFNIKLLSHEDEFGIFESEYIIENQHTKDFFLISTRDDTLGCAVRFYKNTHFKKALMSQHRDSIVKYFFHEESYKCEPWTYFPYIDPILIDKYYNIRKTHSPTNKKLYFKGTSLEARTILNVIDPAIIHDNFSPVPEEEYLTHLVDTKLALSVDGRGEFCYRDIELMGLGIPFIRFEYLNNFNPPLIPNHHYVSIDRPVDMENYGTAGEKYVKLLHQRYSDVIHNDEFLHMISLNSRKYYEDNLIIEKQVLNTYNQLNLDEWLS